MTLGEKVKKRRKELKLSQEELSKLLGYKSKATVHKIENGIININIDGIKNIAKVLNCDIEYLLDLNKQEVKTTEDVCDIEPSLVYVKNFILRLASIHKDDVPIKDLKLTLELNGTTINNFELEKYIQQVVQENIELIKNKMIKSILSTINNI